MADNSLNSLFTFILGNAGGLAKIQNVLFDLFLTNKYRILLKLIDPRKVNLVRQQEAITSDHSLQAREIKGYKNMLDEAQPLQKAIDEQCTYIELDSQGDKKYSWKLRYVRKGMEKLKKATIVLGLATVLCSPVVANTITAPQDPAGSTVANQFTEDCLKSLSISIQNEFATLSDLIDQLVKSSTLVSESTLQQIIAVIKQAVHILDEDFNSQAVLVGTGEDFGFIVQNSSTDADTVAKYIAKQKGQENDPKFTAGMSALIEKYSAKVQTLPKAVVGMVIRNNLASNVTSHWYSREDKISDIYYVKNTWFGDNNIEKTLKNLVDPNNISNYENLKDQFYKLNDTPIKLQPVNTQVNIAQNSINRYLADVAKWGEDTTVPIFKKWITKNKETARKDSIALLTTALEAMEMVGNQYNYTQRNPSNSNTSNNKQ